MVRCRDLTVVQLQDMCRKQHTKGFSRLKKDALRDKCCGGANEEIDPDIFKPAPKRYPKRKTFEGPIVRPNCRTLSPLETDVLSQIQHLDHEVGGYLGDDINEFWFRIYKPDSAECPHDRRIVFHTHPTDSGLSLLASANDIVFFLQCPHIQTQVIPGMDGFITVMTKTPKTIRFADWDSILKDLKVLNHDLQKNHIKWGIKYKDGKESSFVANQPELAGYWNDYLQKKLHIDILLVKKHDLIEVCK